MTSFYEIIPMEDDDRWGVSITDSESKFFGVAALYGKVSAEVLEDTDSAQLSFDYDIIDNPWQSDTEDPDLHDILGKALEDILHSAFDSGKYKIGDEKVESGTADNS